MGARRKPRFTTLRRLLPSAALLVGVVLVSNVILPAGAAEPDRIPTWALPGPGPATSAVTAVSLSPPLSTVPGPVMVARPASTAPSPAPRFLFGSYVKPRGGQTRAQAVAALEAKAGGRFAIDHVYHGWQNPLIGPYERWSLGHGHTLLISWKAALEWAGGTSNGQGAGYVSWSDIASGRYDDLIAARARELKRLGSAVYLTFHHEPEDDADRPWDRRAGSPADFVSAWRHIWQVFKDGHADNVRFVFTLMGWSFKTGNAANFYPGRRYIDVIGSDAYNWFGTAHPGSKAWSDFKSVFGAAYRFAASEHRPFWVTETGVMEDPSNPDRKAAWFRSVRTQIKRWPNLQGFLYFMGGRFGWYADSSPQAMAAFRALARDPYIAGRLVRPGQAAPDLDLTT